MDEWTMRAQAAGVLGDVILGGRVPYAHMPEMLALGDIAIAPKLSLTEGSGKVLNYMAMALPTVAFDTPGQREYLGEDGTYAPLGNSAALAARILALAAQPEFGRVLGQRLRARAIQQFSWEQSAKVMQGMYEAVIKKDGRRETRDG
jgi:glycosyltransferase involved in cell wall biosynthesis